MAEQHVAGKPTTKQNLSVNPNAGPYVGIIKHGADETGQGRVAVFIPALVGQRTSSEENPDRKAELFENCVICRLALPYYGRTNATGKDKTKYANTMKSYGMWFPTPDIDTAVLVMFVEGDREQGLVIAYLPDSFMLHMIPGIPVSPTFHSTTRTKEAKQFSAAGDGKVPAKNASQVPVAEFNKIGHETQLDYKNVPRPVHPFNDTLLAQGLELDYARGLTTSGAQRESPSNVFGILTPGPLDSSGPKIKQGIINTDPKMEAYDWPASRMAGHQFVMDDGDNTGDNRLIRLRTGTGHQLLLNDTDGIIYIGNATGSAWVEMTNAGQIDIFSKQDVSVHTEGNMNFLADKNVHIQSGEDLVMLAGHNLRVETNPSSVSGKGHAHFFINGNMKQTTTGTYNIKTTDWFNVTSKEAISITSLACIFLKSGGGKEHPIKLNTEAGNQAEEASHIPLYNNTWTTLQDATKTYYIDGKYRYMTAMERVPMHEPDLRVHQTSSAPAYGSTPHIVEIPDIST